MSNRAEHYWRCDCGDAHYLAIDIWPDDKDPDAVDLAGYLDVGGNFWGTWRQRLSLAWKVIRIGCADTRVGIVFDPPKAHAIADVLKGYAVRCDAQRNANGRRISGWTCEHMTLTGGALPNELSAITSGCGCQMRPVYEEAEVAS